MDDDGLGYPGLMLCLRPNTRKTATDSHKEALLLLETTRMKATGRRVTAREATARKECSADRVLARG